MYHMAIVTEVPCDSRPMCVHLLWCIRNEMKSRNLELEKQTGSAVDSDFSFQWLMRVETFNPVLTYQPIPTNR